MMQENRSGRQAEIHITQMRRNPYLVDYQTGKNTGRHTGRRIEQRHHSAVPQQENRIRQQKQKTAAAVSDGNVCRDNTYNTRTRQRLTRAERQRRRRRARIRRYIKISLLCASILAGIFMLKNLLEVPASTAEASTPVEVAAEAVQRIEKQIGETTGTRIQGLPADVYAAHPNWTEDFLTVNEYSRPQIPIESVQYIAIHYTANPGATAIANRNYFENLATTHDTKVSSHFVVGLDGEVVQCIPTSEMSYATNSRNVDTLSIECCHPDETGKFNEATYDSAVKLSAWLCVRFGLTSENVIRHYDVTGKNCPKYYVENPDAWIQMKSDIAVQIDVDYGLQDVQ